MAGLFDDIVAKGVRAGQIPARTEAAREWYRNAAKQIKRVNENTLMRQDTDRLHTKMLPGAMYMFQYDPKWKDTLPYYDRVPLIFPFRLTKDGFYGLNLHYLPLTLRARMMDGLYDFTTNKRYDESTRINLSYRLLNGAANLKYYKPCIKQYLYSQLQTRFMYIYPSEWDIAIFLPTARFEKRSANYVHAQSRLKVTM